ncbi:hypothetical protein CA228_19790, partial [Sphingomonas koreensis]
MMTALALSAGPGGGRRRRSPVTLGRIALVGGIALAGFVIWSLFSAQIVTERPNENKTTQVLSLIHIYEPTRLLLIASAVCCFNITKTNLPPSPLKSYS